MILFEGKSGIKVRIICDSISSITGDRLTTYEVEYPRIVHAELMTHRMLSRNAASSRAIPFEKMLDQLLGMPVRFGANVAGMQDNGEHDAPVWLPSKSREGFLEAFTPQEAWGYFKEIAISISKAFKEAGYHKQVFNRLTESCQMIKVVVSATQLGNFFWLRDDVAADPTLHELANLMRQAYNESVPQELKAGEWHLPYVDFEWNAGFGEARKQIFFTDKESMDSISLEDAIKVSCARSAAVSFRNVDYDVEKSRTVYARLIGDQRKHASAFEHAGTPMDSEYLPRNTMSTIALNVPHCPDTWEKGISHMDRQKKLWSGNFKGFIQYRKLIPGENYEG